MASELLKNKALIKKLKEPEIESINFNLADSALDYSVESLEEEILPQPKPQELLDIQEENRKGRLLESLNKIGGGLMDESVDFIKRENFSKAGIAKVVEYVNSLPDGTEVSTKDIREFIEKNNIDANPTSIRNMIAGSAPGKERFKETIKFVDQKGVVKFNEDTFKQIDELLENPKIKSFRDLGEALGYKTPKPSGKRGVTVGGGTPLSRNSAIIKAYVKSRKGDPFEGFKVNFYERGQPKVEKVLELQAKGESTNTIAQKLFKGNRTNVRRIFRLFRPEAIKDPTPKSEDPTTTTKTRASALRAKREADAFKAVGEKTAEQTKKVINTIKNKNADILKMSDAQILNDPKIRYSMSIDATGLKLGEPIKFDKYADLSDKEFVKKVKEKAKNKLFYTPEHISEVAKGKLNTAFPNNIVNAPGRMTSQIGLIKTYLRNNPNGEFAKQADEVLLKTGMQFKTEGKIFGVKENIVFDSKTNKSNIVENYFKDTKEAKIPTATDSKNIAKQLASFGFKCSASEGGACDNPLNYLDDIKKQQAIAKGSGNAAANAVKKLSAGKAIFREVLGPAAIGFELAAAVPITYLGYKAGLPPARIFAEATYGIVGDTEKARLKKLAVKEGVDTTVIDNILNFREKSGALQTLAMQEGDFRGPDDEMLFPQQFEKGEEDFYKAVGRFKDEEGKISKDVFQKQKGLTETLESKIAFEDAVRADERGADIDYTGIGEYLTDGVIPEITTEELPLLPVFDFQEESTRMDFSDGSPEKPGRRTFLKFMAGIASLPFVGKFFKGAKSAKVVKLSNTTTKMPDWFPAFVDKAFEKGIAKKIDADITEVDIPELPNVKVRRYDDGRVEVEGKNGYGEPYEIDYTPPGYELIDETTGKAVKTPGEFQANDTVYRRVGPEGDDFDVDFEVVDDVEQILGGDSTQLEGFAKGTKKDKYTIGQQRIDEADQLGERADEFTPYGDVDPTDFADE